MKQTILVTGANLNIGKELIQLLHTEFDIIGAVSSIQNTSTDTVAQCKKVIELDYDSPSVNQVYDNKIDYLFLLPSKSEERALQAKRLIAGGMEHVKYIVLVSLLDCHSRTGILAAQFRYIEQYIEATGIPFTILRSAPLMQNFFDLKKDFQQKVFEFDIA
jgi:uncharacterized protein YbjT (DUF2867 family)